MQQMNRQDGFTHIFSSVLAATALACVCCAGAAHAQSGKLGAYTGTVNIFGTETGKQTTVTFRASVKIGIPVESNSKTGTRAEVDDVDKPSALASILQWDVAGKNTSADSDGKFTSWTCKLAAPVDVPMNASGALNVDTRAKTHSMFVALVSTKPVALTCINSRSGAYKENGPVSLFFGTSEPDVLPWKELPYSDAAHLAAKYKLVPVSQMKGRYGPADLEWDLQLKR